MQGIAGLLYNVKFWFIKKDSLISKEKLEIFRATNILHLFDYIHGQMLSF